MCEVSNLVCILLSCEVSNLVCISSCEVSNLSLLGVKSSAFLDSGESEDENVTEEQEEEREGGGGKGSEGEGEGGGVPDSTEVPTGVGETKSSKFGKRKFLEESDDEHDDEAIKLDDVTAEKETTSRSDR